MGATAAAWAFACTLSESATRPPAKNRAATRTRANPKLRMQPPLSAESVPNLLGLSNKKEREFLGLAISSKKRSQSQGSRDTVRGQKTAWGKRVNILSNQDRPRRQRCD